MEASSPAERARANATEIASTLVTGVWLVALFTGRDWWLAALLFGYVVVVPVVALLFGGDADREEWSGDRDWRDGESEVEPVDAARDRERDETALEQLRRRYAEGELTEEQLERKLERLLETETLEDVEDAQRMRERERETERN